MTEQPLRPLKLAAELSEYKVDELIEKAQMRECCITKKGLRAVWYAVSTATEIEPSSRASIWQEVIAALNRRRCLSNVEAEILMQGRP